MSGPKVYSVVIGGGFYGVNIALYLARKNKGQVILLEREKQLLSRASYNNQARVHNGYHYPRSLTTAYRSHINLRRFINEWPNCIKKNYTQIYAIARNNSRVTAKQFIRFCKEIGAKFETTESFSHLFNNRLIEQSFLVEEYVFDATVLAEWAKNQLKLSNIEVKLNATASEIKKYQSSLMVSYEKKKSINKISAEKIFNCTYSGLNQFGGDFNGTYVKLKHEVAEIALMQMPNSLKNLGITVMDGPFFSILPFPATGLHTLSHVRYTPHFSWIDKKGINPYEKIKLYEKQTRVDRMVRSVQKYIPEITNAEYNKSLLEVKTTLVKNENDDGRPILFEEQPNMPGLYSILGGKIDNIYDVLERLDSGNF